VVLQRRNWTSFARGYNGRNYKKNEYDTRLAAAFAKFNAILPDISLRTAQAALYYLGFCPGPIDGLRGRKTRSAIIQFQEKHGLKPTGDLDKETEELINATTFG
jgi:peptidoglycan hydrolase-like protein with peptidoglycan-binding domain